jgi:hypothetical protein
VFEYGVDVTMPASGDIAVDFEALNAPCIWRST